MRFRLQCFILIFLLVIGSPAELSAKPGKKLSVDATPVTGFLTERPQQRKFGRLEFLGGLELNSDHDDFGGISGFSFLENASKFLAVTDKGKWISGVLVRVGSVPAGISETRIGSLRKANGKKLKGKREGDSEGLEKFGDTFLISFERDHRVERFSWRDEKLQQVSGIQTIDLNGFDLENNHGPEAIAYSKQTDDLFIFPESDELDAETYRGFIVRDSSVSEIYVKRNGVFSFTDAAFDAKGGLYLLERDYSPLTGVAIRIRHFEASRLKPQAKLEGEILLEANWKHQVDNMEGLAISEMKGGDTRLTLISDDNFSSGQRTLLLEFRLSN